MGSRKRSRQDHKAEAILQLGPKSSETHKEISKDFDPTVPAGETSSLEAVLDASSATAPQSSRSWYGRTWPRISKASPVTQVARESIAAATGVASTLAATARPILPRDRSASLRSPSQYLSRSRKGSSRSTPLVATTTKLNVTSNASEHPVANSGHDVQAPPAVDGGPNENRQQPGVVKNRSVEKLDIETQRKHDVDSGSTSPALIESDDKPVSGEKAPDVSYGWLSWFSKAANQADYKEHSPTQGTSPNNEAGVQLVDSSSQTCPELQAKTSPQDQMKDVEQAPVTTSSFRPLQSRSWLGLWGNVPLPSEDSKILLPPESSKIIVTGEASGESSHENSKIQSPTNDSGRDAKLLSSLSQTDAQSSEVPKSIGWAFWSRENSRIDSSGLKVTVGPPSQSQLEDAIVNEANGVPGRIGKKEKSKLPEKAEGQKSPQMSKNEVEEGNKLEVTLAESKTKYTEQARSKAKNNPLNLVLPSFGHTYRAIEKPSLMQQVGRFLNYSRLPDLKRVCILQNPPRVKRALAIGVHGYFPAPLIRSVLGQPTGTSIRFANGAANAIQNWTQSRGYSCEIEKVALEGEGKIAERIELLWKLMLNWIDNIRKADLVMIACHSQGVPVAMMLVEKLIAFGCVNNCRLGVCALAGVNLGPFFHYKSRWISGSAGQLFDFAHPESQVSKDYKTALNIAVRFGVRIVYIGSIDDQLVSLESATFGTISHPYIFRAVFVDGRIHAPDFLTHLVGFALKLRNLGISDHGLIRELSSALAGSLYSGEGHSRIYEDDSVYHLAVAHALETTSIGDISLQVHREGSESSQNPYILPFAMRGLLEEEFVRTELNKETKELLKQFDDWKPSSKVLKDVKFRLEGVRSKL